MAAALAAARQPAAPRRFRRLDRGSRARRAPAGTGRAAPARPRGRPWRRATKRIGPSHRGPRRGGFLRGFLRGPVRCRRRRAGQPGQGRQHPAGAGATSTGWRRRSAMLLRFGIVARIYREPPPGRAAAAARRQRGGRREYVCQADHELIIAGANVGRYADLIGFFRHRQAGAAGGGAGRLSPRAQSRAFRRHSGRGSRPDGEAEVFDVRIPGINAFDANGLYVHNCGEQPLPPLRRLPASARSISRPWCAGRSRPMPGSTRRRWRSSPAPRSGCSTMPSTCRTSRCRSRPRRRAAKRRIGLGVTGLGDALIMCNARYGASDAVRPDRALDAHICGRAAYLSPSTELCRREGLPFPLFDAKGFLAGESVRELEPEVQAAIARHGIRNALF